MSLSSTPTFCLGKPLLRLTNPFPFIQLQKDIFTKHLKYFFVHTIYIHSLRLQNRFFQPMQCDRIINEIGPLFGNPLLHTPQCINSLSTTRFWRNISLDVFDPLGALYTQENLDSCDILFPYTCNIREVLCSTVNQLRLVISVYKACSLCDFNVVIQNNIKISFNLVSYLANLEP